jgi:hypothetical protein
MYSFERIYLAKIAFPNFEIALSLIFNNYTF